MPVCGACGKDLPESAFYRSRRDRRLRDCKRCHGIANKISYCKGRIRMYEQRITEILATGDYKAHSRWRGVRPGLKSLIEKGGDPHGKEEAEQASDPALPTGVLK